jgi:RNA polymerase subunit RPABC4/transcription elongation factor Spt4
MLGFPGGFGQVLKRRNKWGWLIALAGVTFLFYHTLINPRGELAEALETGNVRLFLSMAIAFVVMAFGLRMYFNWQERRTAKPSKMTPEPIAPAINLEIVPPVSIVSVTNPQIPLPVPLQTEPVIAPPGQNSIPPAIPPISPQPIVTAPVTLPVRNQAQATIVSIQETKQCPACGNLVKAEARVCRFCKATFTVKIRGYCPTEHQVMEATAEGKCLYCNNVVMDLLVESRILKPPPVRPVQAPQGSYVRIKGQTSLDTMDATKSCPACGQTIKAEARICRYCHTMLS